jgi:hypothetical protein
LFSGMIKNAKFSLQVSSPPRGESLGKRTMQEC